MSHATEPRDGMFRIVFRITARSTPVPFTAIGYGGWRSDYLLDWTATTSAGATCVALRQNAGGLPVYSGGTVGANASIRRLIEEDNGGQFASPRRPTIITADFNCDAAVRPGDRVTVQIRFYVRSASGWGAADYSFEDLQVLAAR
jgi:hypothetical protein